jgi:hypothetical protein
MKEILLLSADHKLSVIIIDEAHLCHMEMLTLGWTDGVTFIPLLFRHMSSKDPKLSRAALAGRICA